MQPFYTTEDFEIRNNGGMDDGGKPIMFVFEHFQTNADGMAFNVYKDNGNGSCLPHVKFSFPGRSATRAKVAGFYRDSNLAEGAAS